MHIIFVIFYLVYASGNCPPKDDRAAAIIDYNYDRCIYRAWPCCFNENINESINVSGISKINQTCCYKYDIIGVSKCCDTTNNKDELSYLFELILIIFLIFLICVGNIYILSICSKKIAYQKNRSME